MLCHPILSKRKYCFCLSYHRITWLKNTQCRKDTYLHSQYRVSGLLERQLSTSPVKIPCQIHFATTSVDLTLNKNPVCISLNSNCFVWLDPENRPTEKNFQFVSIIRAFLWHSKIMFPFVLLCSSVLFFHI